MWRTSAQRAKFWQYLGVWARVKRLWRTMLRFIRSFLNNRGELRGELRGDCLELGDSHGEPPEDLAFSFMAWAVITEVSSSGVSLMVPRFFDLLQAGLKLMDIQYSLIKFLEIPGGLYKLAQGNDKVSNRNLVILQGSHIRLRMASPNSRKLLSSFDRHRHKCNSSPPIHSQFYLHFKRAPSPCLNMARWITERFRLQELGGCGWRKLGRSAGGQGEGVAWPGSPQRTARWE